MKDTHVKGWQIKPLSEIAAFSNGLWKGKKGPFTTAKVLRNTNFRPHGALSLNDVAEIEVETKQLQKRRLQKGDIILERSGGGPKQPVGRVVLFDLDDGAFSFSNFTSVIRIADRTEVDPSYLHQVLNWWHASGVTEGIQSRSTGIRNLDFKAYKELKVPLPPLEEQRRIVAILDDAFEGLDRARENAEVNLQNARELFSSVLHDAFGDENVDWVRATLSDLGDIVTGSTPKTSEPDNLGDHLPFVKPGDFQQDGTLIYDNQGLSEKGASVSRIVPAGSALMVCIGATIGKSGYTDRPVATNQQINAIIPKESIEGEYLYLQMLTPEFQAAVLRGAGQATLPIINKSKWSKLEVRLPRDLTLQRSITEKLSGLRSSLDQVVSQYSVRLDELDELRQSILQKAFAGEFT